MAIVTDEIEYMTADQEENCVIAQASAPLDESQYVCRADLLGALQGRIA